MKNAINRVTVVSMDAEDKKKLDRILALAEENNEYVRQVRRGQKTSQMFKAIWWVLGLALAASAYYSLKPYLGTVQDAYSKVQGLNASLGK